MDRVGAVPHLWPAAGPYRRRAQLYVPAAAAAPLLPRAQIPEDGRLCRNRQEEQKGREFKRQKAEKTEKPAKKENKKQPKPQPKAEVKAEVKEEPKQETAEEVKAEEEASSEEISLEAAPAKVKYAVEFIKSVIGQFYENEAEFRIVKTQTGYIIKIVGEDAGCLIGRKGETMEALSYLTSLASNRFEDSDEKISVDVADYRQKREKDLVAVAKKMAAKVNKSGRSYAFEPMNPYERRIIHATVSEIAGVKSESKGEGSNRKVVIYPTNPRKSAKGGERKPNNNRRNDRRDRKEKPAPQVQKTRETKLVDDFGGTTGLYGKIEL